MQINKLAIIKTAAQVVASAGASKVVKDIITNNTTVETTADQARVLAGSIVIGSIVTDHASFHATQKIDQAAAWLRERKNRKNETEETE